MITYLILITLFFMIFLDYYTYKKIREAIRILPANLLLQDEDYYYYSIKSSFHQTGLIFFNVLINEKTYTFLIDSGANVNLLDTCLYNELKKANKVIDTNNQTQVGFHENPTEIANNVELNFKLIDILYTNVSFLVTSCSAFNIKETYNMDLHGILGGAFLKEQGWIINYEKLIVKIPKIKE